MDTAAVVFTVEELASLAQAAETFSALLAKIKAAAPDAWASVQSDFNAAVTGFESAEPTSASNAADVEAIVSSSGSLPGIPEPSSNVALDPPAVAANEQALAAGVTALLSGADALPVGVHVQADPAPAVQVTPPAPTETVVGKTPEVDAALATQIAAAKALLAANPNA